MIPTKRVQPSETYPQIQMRTLDHADRDWVTVEAMTWVRLEHEGKYYLVRHVQSDLCRDFTASAMVIHRLHMSVYASLHFFKIDPEEVYIFQDGRPGYYLDHDQTPEPARLHKAIYG
jgi:hypothetical protein